MGTRSQIGYALKDDSIVSVYCHWDGYPEFNGKVLNEFFTTSDAVRDLIDGGNLSSLYTNSDWERQDRPFYGPLYYTERGEKISNNQPHYSSNLTEYLQHTDDSCGEYAYIFKNGEWVCYKVDSRLDGYTEVPIPAGSVFDDK